MVGGQSSKEKGVETPTSPPPPGPPPLQITADLTSYEDACSLDPDLQSFDATLHEKTNRVINPLYHGVEVTSLSLDSLSEVTESFLEINQEVVKVILQSKEDIWKNKESFPLVEEYFENSVKTLEFCAALENCLKRARNSQLIIQFALRKFEVEVALNDGAVETKFVKTLEELGKLKAAGDPFGEEFFVLFQSVYRQQVSMRKWCNSLWSCSMKAVKWQKELLSSMKVGTFIVIKAMDDIRVLVNKLKLEIELLLHNVNTPFIGDNALRIMMDEIKKKLGPFRQTIEYLGEHASKCSRDIRQARTVILQKIIRYTDR